MDETRGVKNMHYILNPDHTVSAVSLMEWAQWLQSNRENRIVQQTHVGHMWVSTVFLGLDHNFDPNGPPLLFETMVFYSGHFNDLWSERCTTWDEAIDQHVEGITFAKSSWPNRWKIGWYLRPFMELYGEYKRWSVRRTLRSWYKDMGNTRTERHKTL